MAWSGVGWRASAGKNYLVSVVLCTLPFKSAAAKRTSEVRVQVGSLMQGPPMERNSVPVRSLCVSV